MGSEERGVCLLHSGFEARIGKLESEVADIKPALKQVEMTVWKGVGVGLMAFMILEKVVFK